MVLVIRAGNELFLLSMLIGLRCIISSTDTRFITVEIQLSPLGLNPEYSS